VVLKKHPSKLYWGKVNARVQTIHEEAFKDGKVSTPAEAAKCLAK
jgi:hypothetical protein